MTLAVGGINFGEIELAPLPVAKRTQYSLQLLSAIKYALPFGSITRQCSLYTQNATNQQWILLDTQSCVAGQEVRYHKCTLSPSLPPSSPSPTSTPHHHSLLTSFHRKPTWCSWWMRPPYCLKCWSLLTQSNTKSLCQTVRNSLKFPHLNKTLIMCDDNMSGG